MKHLNKELEELNVNIGNRILRSRTILGVTRNELAQVIGISQQQLAKYENGVNRISASRLSLVAKKFSVSINHFYTDILNFEKKLPIESSVNLNSHLSLINKLSKLKNKEQVKSVSLLLDALLKKCR